MIMVDGHDQLLHRGLFFSKTGGYDEFVIAYGIISNIFAIFMLP